MPKDIHQRDTAQQRSSRLLLAMGITASSIGLNSTLDALAQDQAPFDITIQNQNGDVQQVDFDGELNAAGFDTSEKLSWQRDFLIYYGDTAVTGLYSSGVISLTDYNACGAPGRRVTTPAPYPPLLPREEVVPPGKRRPRAWTW